MTHASDHVRRASALAVLALIPLGSTAASAEEKASTDAPRETVTWGTGGDAASGAYAIFGYGGVAYRFDNSPYGAPDYRTGPSFGLTGLVRPWRWASVGLGYQRTILGTDQADQPPSSFVEVSRKLDTGWALGRAYAVRNEDLSVYFTIGAGLTMQHLNASTLKPSVTGPVGTQTSCSASGGPSGALRLGLGLEVPAASRVLLGLELGVDRHWLSSDTVDGCANGAGATTMFGARLGAAYGVETRPVPPPPDGDHDGITDASDACPETVGVPDADAKKNGCPPTDRDHDGIVDSSDACPDSAGVASTELKNHGCPKAKDTDQDGFTDDVDGCPSLAGAPNADPTKNGCPVDSDGDGIEDAKDACANEKGVPSANATWNGCPPDSDGDGIYDSVDACPNEKGVPSADPKKIGCPLVQRTATEIVLNAPIAFAADKATIEASSFALLDQVAAELTNHPEIVKVEVQGHTDGPGKAYKLVALSQDRASAIVKALVERKIDAKRLSAKGYSDAKPAADKALPEAPATTRVVLVIGDKPHAETAKDAKPANKPADKGAKPANKPADKGAKPATKKK